MQYLYDSHEDAKALDAAVCKAQGWPEGGTKQWAEPTQVDRKGHEYAGMWYVPAPPDYVDMESHDYPEPDVKAEMSSDWHPEPEL